MGRPLNKKYFGNRNIGSTSVTTDNGIGGQGIASVTIAGTNNNYIAVPTATFAAPTLPGGVTATAGAITMIVKSVSITNGGGSYIDEEVVTLGDGSAAGGTGTVDGTYTTRASFRIKSVDGGGAATTIELVAGGSYTVLAYNGSTHASAAGSTITEMYTTGGTGNNLRIAITWGVLAVAINEKGSGYVSAPSITMTGNATKAAVLTTDTGNVGATTNQENAIIAYAFHTGGSLLLGDITKQVSTDRYKVKNTTATAIAKLKATIANAAGEMNIVATDTDGKTYYVIKLTSRKATLVPAAVARLSTSAGTIFAPDTAGVYKMVPWKFDAAVTGYVQIENA
jgi:hypothetical protein